MAAKIWKVGDTCYLKSGSPRMTIVTVEGTQVAVRWTSFETILPTAAIKANWK